MFRHITTLTLVPFIMVLASSCSKEVSFAKDVHPILDTHCMECHVKGKKGHQESGLSMETYADLMKGTNFGPVIVKGDSLSSTLSRLIDHKADKAINMPHDKQKIPAKQIGLINTWIDQGAKNN
ncbi:MAG: c-type cytochrome domain-containing protein [Gammaproteobacteria bacterium]